MFKKALLGLLVLIILIVGYFVAWPVPIEPCVWKAPSDPGYTDKFAPNDRLKGVELLQIANCHGPEAVAFDDKGQIGRAHV